MKKKAKGRPSLNFVKVQADTYGQGLRGFKIYYQGKKPSQLKPDGRITLGKNILEFLKQHFGTKFRWILTEETSEITIEYGVYRVRTSAALLKRMIQESFARTRDG